MIVRIISTVMLIIFINLYSVLGSKKDYFVYWIWMFILVRGMMYGL